MGLTDVAGKRVETFSLGMSQRLGIATALLGDPRILLFDEPVNGLDPEGIVWVRNLMKRLASEGRTIFVSSHLMSEMQDTAEHVLVIGRGKLIADMSIREFIQSSSTNHVRVLSPRASELAKLLEAQGAQIAPAADGERACRYGDGGSSNRRHRRREQHCPARAFATASQPRSCLHGADPGRRAVPRR